jgi:hypothetical protein
MGGGRCADLDDYEFNHLIEDLVDIGDEDGLHWVLGLEEADGSSAWFRARDRRGETAGYLTDLARAWNVADRAATAHTRARRSAAVALQCRYALMSAAFDDLAAIISPDLVARLVETGCWTQAQALAYSQRSRPETRLEVLVDALGRATGEQIDQLARESLAAARTVAEDVERVERVIVSLAEKLPPTFLPEMLGLVHDVRDASSRGKALEAAADRLPDELLGIAVELANGIEDPRVRAEALSAFVSRLPEDEGLPLFDLAVQAAREASNPIDVLSVIARRVPLTMAMRLPDEASTLPEGTSPTRLHAVVLGRYAEVDPQLALISLRREDGTAMDEEALEKAALALARAGDHEEALEALKSLSSWGLAKALAHLSELLPPSYLPAALAEVRNADEQFKHEALAALARRADTVLAEAIVREALDTKEPRYRARALAAVAASLPEHLTASALHAAYMAAIDPDEHGLDNLRTIAGRLHLSLALEALQLTSGSLVEQLFGASPQTVGVLAARVAELGEPAVSVETIVGISEPRARIQALAPLAQSLPPELLDEAWQRIEPPRCERARLDALIALAENLPVAVHERILLEIEELPYAPERVDRLLAIGPALSTKTQARAMHAALANLRKPNFGKAPDVIDALERILAQLPASEMPRALRAIRQIEDFDVRLSALVAFARRAPSGVADRAWQHALRACFRLPVREGRDYALEWLMPKLPADFHGEVLSRASRLSADDRAIVLLGIAKQLTERDRARALDATLALPSPQLRFQAVREMLDALPTSEPGAVVERAFATLAGEPSAYENGWEFFAAAELAPYDESPKRQARGETALSWARQRQSVSERAETLAMLAGSLAEPCATQALADAFLALDSTADDELKETVGAFAAYLAPRDLATLVDFWERRMEKVDHEENENLVTEISSEFIGVAVFAGQAGYSETAMRAVSLIPEWLREEALEPLVAELPVPHLLRAAYLCEDNGVRGAVAERLAASKDWSAALGVLESMVAKGSFSSAEASRGEVIAKVAAVAPRRLLPRLLSLAWTLPTGYDRAEALPTILERLAPTDRRAQLGRALESGDNTVMAAVSPLAAVRLPTLAASHAWRRALRRASRGGRDDTYACIAALTPLITANGADATLEICETFAGVDRWWSHDAKLSRL